MSYVEDAPRAYRAFALLFRWYFRLYHRLRVEGMEHIPESGGCLIACNHTSYLDPPAIGCMVRHRVFRFVARNTLWEGRFNAWFFRVTRCIPISRETGDLAAMRAVLKAVKAGDLVALFPEGTRSVDGQLGEAKPGIGFLVARAGVPLVPVAILGSHRAYGKGVRFVRPTRVLVRYGTPIQPHDLPTISDPKPSYEAISAFVMEKIRALMDESPV